MLKREWCGEERRIKAGRKEETWQRNVGEELTVSHAMVALYVR